MTRLLVLSDLHLEFSNMNLSNEDYDILVLAGDTSQDDDILNAFLYKTFLLDKPVVLVLGNHEFEGKCFDDVLIKVKGIEQDFPNVHILYNQAIDLLGVRFIGSTLWSNFESNGIDLKPVIKDWTKQNIADFSSIYVKINEHNRCAWTPDTMESEFNKAYSFLEYELKHNPSELPKVVVTHFAPHKKSIHEKYAKDICNAYWVNDLENLMGFSEYWIHGHVHHSVNYEVEGTNVICNPRGASNIYDLASNTDFNKNLIIEV